MEDKALTENRFMEILKQREEEHNTRKKKNTSFGLILLFIILCAYLIVGLTILKMGFANSFLQTSVNAYDKIMLEKNTDYVVEWFYQCPSYSNAFYNCPKELSYMNMTGQYCNRTMVCQNNYIIHLKQNRTGQ